MSLQSKQRDARQKYHLELSTSCLDSLWRLGTRDLAEDPLQGRNNLGPTVLLKGQRHGHHEPSKQFSNKRVSVDNTRRLNNVSDLSGKTSSNPTLNGTTKMRNTCLQLAFNPLIVNISVILRESSI